MRRCASRSVLSGYLTLWLSAAISGPNAAGANLPGGGTGAGPDVTVTDNGNGTVTMANGIVSIVIVKKTSRLNEVTYTCDRKGRPQTNQMLLGKGQYYYGGFMLGNGAYEYSLATDPATNKGNYADVKLISVSETNGVMETHFSMLRGSPGYYSTAIMTHRKQDAAFEVGAWGVITRVPPSFNWLSADDARNMFIGTRTRTDKTVPHSPHEITVNLDGTQAGEFADKFIYAQDHAGQRAWGWSSVGKGGSNVGIWMMTNMEFSNGGPMKRDVGVYPYSELNNSILTGELGMGSDGFLAAGEEWTKTCGTWFVYMNNVPAEIDDPRRAAHALYADALAQAEAERKAWPYEWFKHDKYVPAAGRGTVKGKFVIRDHGNPNASPSGLWVGLVEQPHTVKGYYDFQKWLRPYQFFARTDCARQLHHPQRPAQRELHDMGLWARRGGHFPVAGTIRRSTADPLRPAGETVRRQSVGRKGHRPRYRDLDAGTGRRNGLRTGIPRPQGGQIPPRRRLLGTRKIAEARLPHSDLGRADVLSRRLPRGHDVYRRQEPLGD